MNCNPKAVLCSFIVGVAAGFSGLFLLPGEADACSWLSEGRYVSRDLAFEHPIPTDGVVTFRITVVGEEEYLDPMEVQVTDASGGMVVGNLSFLQLLREPELPWGELPPGYSTSARPPYDVRDFVAVWKPEQLLAANSSYRISVQGVRVRSEQAESLEATFQTESSPPQVSFASPSISVSPKIHEARTDFECCEDESLCDSCDCVGCWATSYHYLPMVQTVTSLAAQPEIGGQLFFRVSVNGEVRERYFGQRDRDIRSSLYLPQDAQGPFCVTLEVVRLGSGEIVHSEVRDYTRDDFPDYTERAVTDESPPPECNAEQIFSWQFPTPGTAAPEAGNESCEAADVYQPSPDAGTTDGEDASTRPDVTPDVTPDAQHTNTAPDTADAAPSSEMTPGQRTESCACETTRPTTPGVALFFAVLLLGASSTRRFVDE